MSSVRKLSRARRRVAAILIEIDKLIGELHQQSDAAGLGVPGYHAVDTLDEAICDVHDMVGDDFDDDKKRWIIAARAPMTWEQMKAEREARASVSLQEFEQRTAAKRAAESGRSSTEIRVTTWGSERGLA